MFSQKKALDAAIRLHDALVVFIETEPLEWRDYYEGQLANLIEIVDAILDGDHFKQFSTHVEKRL